jgi:hypothetical protein
MGLSLSEVRMRCLLVGLRVFPLSRPLAPFRSPPETTNLHPLSGEQFGDEFPRHQAADMERGGGGEWGGDEGREDLREGTRE